MTAAHAIARSVADEGGTRLRVEARTLRVLTLTPFYPSQEHPAQGCFISEPLGELRRRNVAAEVIAVQPFYRGPARPLASDLSSRWRRYFSLPGNLGLPLAGDFLAASLSSRMREAHARQPFDLIHAHAALPCGVAALSLSKALRIPFVVTVHGLDADFTEQAGPRIGNRCARIARRVYEFAAAVICISEKVRQQVLRTANARTIVVYNGVDTSLFHPSGEEDSSRIILSVGNLIPAKGHALLLRAFARVAGAFSDCSLEIIGDGPERTALTAVADELNLSPRVNFLGPRNRQEVASAMRKCAIFALPSAYEGLGCVYLEAMASGKPAIGCNGQGIDEIIENGRNGMLASTGSESELAEALQNLLSDTQLRQRIGALALETVRSRHTIAHQADQLAEIYRAHAQ